MDRGGAPTKMPKALANAVENITFKCGCVIGSIVLDTDPTGGTYTRFLTATSVYEIDEKKCRQEGLN